jgi:hypothetical protein
LYIFLRLLRQCRKKKLNMKKLVIKSQKPLQYDCEQLQWLLAHLIYIKSRRISYRLTLSAAPKHSHSVATPTRTSKINIPWPGLSHALFFICFPWHVFGEHFICALQHHNTFTQSVPEIWHTAHSNNYSLSLSLMVRLLQEHFSRSVQRRKKVIFNHYTLRRPQTCTRRTKKISILYQTCNLKSYF